MNERLTRFYKSFEGERSRFVHTGFAAVAPVYDGLTRVFSFGLDGRWRRCCLDACQLRPGRSLLDVATGTGELAIEGARRVNCRGRVVGLDVCTEMLLEAQRKAGERGQRIAWVQGKAECLPFNGETFDCVTTGLALRHVADLDETLKEMVRVLKPGGRLGIVEFTQPEGSMAPLLLYAYLSGVVPPLVGLLSCNRRVFDLARYLPVTIKRFVSTDGLRRSMAAVGLAPVTVQRYLAGMVSVCVGTKGDRNTQPG